MSESSAQTTKWRLTASRQQRITERSESAAMCSTTSPVQRSGLLKPTVATATNCNNSHNLFPTITSFWKQHVTYNLQQMIQISILTWRDLVIKPQVWYISKIKRAIKKQNIWSVSLQHRTASDISTNRTKLRLRGKAMARYDVQCGPMPQLDRRHNIPA